MTTATEVSLGGTNHDHHQHATKPSTSAPASFLPKNTAPLTDARTNTTNTGDSLPNLGDLDARCGGCQNLIDQESGGVVVAFGSSLWHVDCFRCAKCNERVSADTNLLLLSDGSPVCGNCSYQCYVCKKAITEEAIMTGDESYHAQCFTCRTCKRRIEELVFAKTSQGIYCMACHNDRVARSRRHAEARRQRAARKDKEREREEAQQRDKENQEDARARTVAALNGTQGSQSNLQPGPAPTNQEPSPFGSPAATPLSVSSPQFSDNPPIPESDGPRSRELSVENSAPKATTPNLSADHVSMPVTPSDSGRLSSDRSPQPSNLRSPSPARVADASPSRSPNVGLGVGPVSMSSGLGVPTSKADKRRSINPAMSFNMDSANSTFAAEPRLSPLPPSPLRSSFTEPLRPGRRSEDTASPTSARGGVSPVRGVSPACSSPQGDEKQNSPRPPAPPPKQPVAESPTPESRTTPQLHPGLPQMSFSLSDPDFALILNSIDQSPIKAGKMSAESNDTARPPEIGEASTRSSPPVTDSPSITRSDHSSDMLSAAAGHVPLRTPPRTQLSPGTGAGSTPLLLRSRQPSAESTISLSRLDADSSFAAVTGLVAEAKHNQQEKVEVDVSVLGGMIAEMEELKDAMVSLRNKYTGAKRTSQQYSEGLTVAGEEYDKEVAHRRDLEAEVSRLRAQVHSQTARLSVISGDERRQENMRRRSNDLAVSLTGLERDISRLRAQRDMTLAEVEELRNNSKSDATDDAGTALSQSLTTRLDTIKEQYREELEPLTAQREALHREIAELRETREQFLEESAALAAKNEELAELNAQLARQTEQMQDGLSRNRGNTMFSKNRTHPSGSPSLSSLATSATLHEVPEETARVVKVTKPEPIEAAPARRFKWYKSSKGPDMSSMSASISRPLAIPPGKNNNQRPSTEMGLRDHQFQQHSTMRFTRCELCQEKMWGLQEVRCATCGIVCHAKCAEKLPKMCTGSRPGQQEVLDGPMPPSMFGRELAEQVAADKLPVPAIVTKCIAAVEVVGMEYEGIYRKTGGSSQSKQITQLFERGDYESFDLADLEVFNDISSTTSVLKTYFRQLPDPLLTHSLHESFVAAASIRDGQNKHSALCALLKELPKDNYNTLRLLMLHLNRVAQLSSVNLMTSQNLGVVFGPTLMRSSDPGREFGDMAGKALSIQWMVDNAPQVFAEQRS